MPPRVLEPRLFRQFVERFFPEEINFNSTPPMRFLRLFFYPRVDTMSPCGGWCTSCRLSQRTWFWSASFTCGDIHKSGHFLLHSRGEPDLVICVDWDGPFPRIPTKWRLLEWKLCPWIIIASPTAHYATNGFKLKCIPIDSFSSGKLYLILDTMFIRDSEVVAGQAIKGGIVCVHACLRKGSEFGWCNVLFCVDLKMWMEVILPGIDGPFSRQNF